MFDPRRAHNQLPALPPKVEIETKPVLKRCVQARAALAELRFAGQLIPDQSVLINTIPVLETRDSSAIENIVTTNDSLFRQASLEELDAEPATKAAMRYRTALHRGFAAVAERPISTRMAVEICQTITGIDLDVRKISGTALKNTFTGEVIYTPPEGEDRLRNLLANWEQFINEPSDIDPLVRMAVLHHQFEAIHPFSDGNGRTGRILNILALVQAKLLDLPTLCLSRHILRTRGDYYRLLLRVTSHGEWEPWILYMLNAVEIAATWTSAKVRAIRRLMDATAEHMRIAAPKICSRDLLDAVFGQPYCRIANVVQRGVAKRQTASAYLQTLTAIGVLNELQSGRDKLFVNWKYSDLLNSDDHDFEPYISS